MKEKNLALALKNKVIDENILFYKNTLDSFNKDEITDLHWKKLIDFYRQQPEENKDLFVRTIRQVAIDSVSNILGIIDGSVDFDYEIKLVELPSREQFDDFLQDEFLGIIEDVT